MILIDLVILCTTVLVIILTITAAFGLFARVPYVPTPKRVARAMVDLSRLRGDEHVFDLGAGTATVLIEAKRTYPGLTATGIEMVPTVWLLGRFWIWLSGVKIHFLLGDAKTVNVEKADVVFLYLSPWMMKILEEKFDRELSPGTTVISHSFTFPVRQPVETVKIPLGRRQRTIHRYQW